MLISISEAQRRYPGAVMFRFGDSHALNMQILKLVKEGKKTVSCDAVANFEKRSEAVPKPGDVGIAEANNGMPHLAIRTVSVDVIPFDQMTEELIPDQGEFVDLADWRAGYEAYLTRAGVFAPDVMMVVERFELVEIF